MALALLTYDKLTFLLREILAFTIGARECLWICKLRMVLLELVSLTPFRSDLHLRAVFVLLVIKVSVRTAKKDIKDLRMRASLIIWFRSWRAGVSVCNSVCRSGYTELVNRLWMTTDMLRELADVRSCADWWFFAAVAIIGHISVSGHYVTVIGTDMSVSVSVSVSKKGPWLS